MSTSRTTLTAIGFLVLGALGSASLSAVAEEGHGRHRGGHGMQALLDGVILTEAQQQDLEEMKAQMKAEREEHRAERTEKSELVRELLEADSIDRQDLYDRIDDKLAAKRELMRLRADFMADFIESLDEDQRAAVLENLAEVEAAMEERRSRGAEDGRRRPGR